MSKKHDSGEDCVININGVPVPVTREVYEAHCEMENHERYMRRMDKEFGLLFAGDLNHRADRIDSIHGTEIDPEKIVIAGILLVELQDCIGRLNDVELKLMIAIYVNKASNDTARQQKGRTIHLQ